MKIVDRRTFVQLAGAALAGALSGGKSEAQAPSTTVPQLGVVAQVSLGKSSDSTIKQVHQLGFLTCQIFFEHLSMHEVGPLLQALDKYGVQASAISEHNPGPRVFDFYGGPLTIGLVPLEYRKARIEALKLAADFARECSIPSIHTHLGFIPEDPNDPKYPAVIAAIKEVAQYCKDQGRILLCETGEETPITMLRMIQDVATGNVFVNLDTANLILYGKGNPVDAMEVFGHLVRGVHAKDGLFPRDPRNLGKEVVIGTGDVAFPALFRKLKANNYTHPITIEREISGTEQIRDILESKTYLQRLIHANYGV